MSRRAKPKKRSRSPRRNRGRGWVTLILFLLIGFFAVSIYLGRTREPAQPAKPAVLELPPPVVPDAHSPTLVIWNGCGRGGLGAQVARWMRRQGFDVREAVNADRSDYPQTLVVARSKREEAVEAVVTLLQEKLGIGVLIQQRVKAPEADVLLILGRDFPDSLVIAR